jgi:hypothetical protein
MSDLSQLSLPELRAIVESRLPVDADHETFMTAVRQKANAGLELGLRWNWWTGYSNGVPNTPPKIVQIADYSGKLMAHVMADVGFFPSLSQARKNGWDRPVELGEFRVGKNRIVQIV